MKKYFLILVVLTAGCATIQQSERVVVVTGFDFTQYTKKGFLFTPESYNDKYESMGLITATIYPAVKLMPAGSKADINKYYYVDVSNGVLMIEKLYASEVIAEMYNIAVKMGADAVANFSIRNIDTTNGPLKIPGYELTGFAIKRNK